jgi:hypothetical protein
MKTLMFAVLFAVGCAGQSVDASTSNLDTVSSARASTVTDFKNGDCVRVYRSDPRLPIQMRGDTLHNVGCLAFVASGDDALDTLDAAVVVSHDDAACTCSAQ